MQQLPPNTHAAVVGWLQSAGAGDRVEKGNSSNMDARSQSAGPPANVSDPASGLHRQRSRLQGSPAPAVLPAASSQVPPPATTPARNQSPDQWSKVRAAMDAAMMHARGSHRAGGSVPHMRPISEEGGAPTAMETGVSHGQRSASAQSSYRPDGHQGYYSPMGGPNQGQYGGRPSHSASSLSRSQSSRSPSPAAERWAMAMAASSGRTPSSERKESTSDKRRAERQQQREREQVYQPAGVPGRHRSPAAERWSQAAFGRPGPPLRSPPGSAARAMSPDGMSDVRSGTSKSSAPRSFAAQKRMEKQQSVARSRWEVRSLLT